MDNLVKSLQEFPEMMELNPRLIGFRTLTKNISGIYAIFNSIDGRIYIGSAVSISNRMSIHKNDLRKNRHHSKHLQNFYNKYGKECLAFALLLEIENPTKDKLIEAEQYFIDVLNPKFNIRLKADSNLGIKWSHESRKKLSDKRLSMNIRYDDGYKKRMSIALSGENNPMYGTKGKLSPNYGKKHKPETIQKMIKSHPDVRGKNNPKYGIPQDPEATAKARITKRKRNLARGRGIRVLKNDKTVAIFHSSPEAAEELGIDVTSIRRACNGEYKQCKGFTFEFTGKEPDGIPKTIRA